MTKELTKAEYLGLLDRSARDGTFPGVDPQGSCQYRGVGKTKCAVGVLIPDENYVAAMEGSVFALFLYAKGRVNTVAGLVASDLREVQRIHDRMAYGWDADIFMAQVRALPFFQGVEPAVSA